MKWLTRIRTFTFALLLILQGCGGCGGSSDDPTQTTSGSMGLEIASSMSFVKADASASTSISGLSKALQGILEKALTTDTTTAFYTDSVDIHVFDDSMEPVKIIDEILCYLDQTGYVELVNQGTYIALIDENTCNKDENRGSSNSNQSSGASAEELMEWVIKSSREEGQNHIVHFWVPEEGDEHQPANIIQAKLTILEGKSDEHPFGKFHMDFKMLDAETESVEMGHGLIETIDDRTDDLIEFQFLMKGTEAFPVTELAHVVTNAERTSGHAFTALEFAFGEFSESRQFNVAFNATHYRTHDGTAEQCLDLQNRENRVFRYRLYNEDGSVVAIDKPGFGIQAGNNYGWAGYWGIWFDNAVTIEDGMAVTRANNDDTDATYTLIDSPGKLLKYTRKAMTLSDIKGDLMNWWNEEDGRSIRIVWDGSNFLQHSLVIHGQSGETYEAIAGTPILDLGQREWIHVWRQGIGNIDIQIPESRTLADATEIVTFTEEIVTPGHADFAASGGSLSFSCFEECVRPSISADQINWSNEESPFFEDSEDIAAPYAYTISADDMTLKFDSAAVKLADGVIPSEGGPNHWGVRSGPLVTADIVSQLDNTWDVWGESIYYVWETGINEWNRYRGLKDSDGNSVVFSQPIAVDYTHEATGDRYILDYSGELNGIPWLESEELGRWYPAITIPDKSPVVSGDTTYYVKGIEIEQTLPEVDSSNCSGLEFQQLTDPSEADYTDPGNGPMPTVEEDPKVIKGVVTGS